MPDPFRGPSGWTKQVSPPRDEDRPTGLPRVQAPTKGGSVISRDVPTLIYDGRAWVPAEAYDRAQVAYCEFIDGLTAKLNEAGVPAMPSWPEAIDWLAERADRARDDQTERIVAALEAKGGAYAVCGRLIRREFGA